MRKYIIYKITNLINGKIYIGRTSVGIESRWRGHLRRFKDGLYNHLRLYRAFAKYGIENFRIEEIDCCLSFEEMKKTEGEWIIKLNSFNKEVGYNMSIDTEKGIEFLSEDSLEKRRTSIHTAHSNKRLNKSGYLGVSIPYKGANFYRGGLNIQGVKYLFSFKTIEEAAECHDKLAVLFHGKEAVLNFPEKIDIYLNENLENYLQFQINNKGTNRTDGYVGVRWLRTEQRWSFIVSHKLTRKNLQMSIFDSEEEAYKAQLEFVQNNPDYCIYFGKRVPKTHREIITSPQKYFDYYSKLGIIEHQVKYSNKNIEMNPVGLNDEENHFRFSVESTNIKLI